MIIEMIKDKWNKLDKAECVRYVIAGVSATGVNLVTFAFLRKWFDFGLTFSNFLAIMLAMVYAFVMNRHFVFHSEKNGTSQVLSEAIQFFGGRVFTMMIEIVGVFIMYQWFDFSDMAAKFVTQGITLVINYVVSKFIVFKERDESAPAWNVVRWANENWVYLLSFFLPALMFLGLCIKLKVTPFGNNTLMIIDSLHQYLPFFSEYYDKLTTNGEFLYTWNGAMGMNFITLWAYYLSSPFNLLILLFEKAQINTAMTLIIGLKISLCSFIFSYMLSKKTKKRDVKVVLFGLCYAFSNYVIGYYWNIMWLDVLLLTPLVVLGLDYLIHKKDIRLYTITLFLALFSNFYIGFMLCIFLVLWFFVESHKNVKEFFQNGIRFAFASLLAGGMAAVVLIPTYYGIMLTGPAADKSLPKFEWYQNILQTLKMHAFYSGTLTNSWNDGDVNIYCGVLSIFLLILYFCLKQIPFIRKIKYGILIGIFWISFNATTPNFIWHGFHSQFGIPNRFAFLYIFVVLCMGFEVLQHIKEINFWTYFIPMGFLVAFVIYNNEVKMLYDDTSTLRATMFIFAGYFIIFMLHQVLQWKEETLVWILTFAVFAEITANAIYSFNMNGQINMADYFSDTKVMRNAIASVQDDGFYREELSDNNLVDENVWLNLKSIGLFGSTNNGKAVDTLNKMGFYTAANEHLYDGATPLTDALLGVKYLYKRSSEPFDHGFDLYKTVDGVEVYKNPHALSIGYLVRNAAKDWDVETGEAPDSLNDFAEKAACVSNLFKQQSVEYTGEGTCCEVEDAGYGEGTYSYTRTEDGAIQVHLTFKAQTDQPLYARATGTDLSGIAIAVNGKEVCNGRYFFQNVYVGDTTIGDEVTVTYMFNDDAADDQTVNLKVYSMDQDKFEAVYEQLEKNQLQVTSYKSNEIKGTFETDQDGVFMTTIIDEPGWTMYVDGKKVKTYDIGNTFLSTDIKKGKHTIKITFVPESLPVGAGITVVSWLLFIAALKIKKIRDKKIKEELKYEAK